MIRIVICCSLLFVPLMAPAGEEGAWWGGSRYTAVARWMLEQPDVEMRAAGLAALAGGGLTERRIGPARYMAEVESILDSEPTGAAVYMIAQGCDELDLLEACSRAGVPEAVERLDGGNPLAATLFHDSESPEFRQVLISAESIDDHYPESVSAWFDALLSRKSDDMEEGFELTAATSIAQAIAIPALQPITESCRSAVGSDEALDRACRRLSKQMHSSGRTIILESVGYGMARSRAEKMGNELLVEEYKSERDALFFLHPSDCALDVVGKLLGTDTAAQRRFLAEMRANGEEAAFRTLYEQYGADCEE